MSLVRDSYPYALVQLVASFAVVLFNYGVVTEHFRRVQRRRQNENKNSNNNAELFGGSTRSIFALSSSPSSRSVRALWSSAGGSSADVTASPPRSPSHSLSRRHSSKYGNSHHMFHKRKKSASVKRKQRLALIMTVICVGTSLMRSTLGLYLKMVAFHLLNSPLFCSMMIQMIGILYATSKASLYCVFINRIDLSFSETMYAYSDRTIQLCYLIVLLEWLCILAWAPFAVGSETSHLNYHYNGKRINNDSNDHNNHHRNAIHVCRPLPGLLISAFAVLFDIIFMGSMVLMFIRPLRKIFAQDSDAYRIKPLDSRNNNNNNNVNLSELRKLEFRLLPLKYTVLSVTAVITSCLALLFLIIGIDLLQTLDNPVNVFCLLLMSGKHWKKDFWLICGPLLRSLHSVGLLDDRVDEHIGRVVGYFSSNDRELRMKQLSIAHRVLSSASLSLELDDLTTLD